MSLSPAARRRKGHDFERWIAKQLRKFYPESRRGYQSRGGGKEESDVLGIPGWAIEVKHRAVVTWGVVKDAVRQSENDAGPGRYPIAIIRKNRDKEPMVVMSWSTWLDLLEEQRKEWSK